MTWAATIAFIIRCDWSTPFGSPVVPEVNASPMMSRSEATTGGSTSTPVARRASYGATGSSADRSSWTTSRIPCCSPTPASISAYLASWKSTTGSARPTRTSTSLRRRR